MSGIRALVLPVDEPGRLVTLTPDGERGLLKAIQAAVGGYIEAVTFPSASMYLNEDGKALGLGRNGVANALLGLTGTQLLPGDYIAGAVVVLGEPDDEGYDTDCPDGVLNLIRLAGIPVLDETEGA